jgi:hypothetical protein
MLWVFALFLTVALLVVAFVIAYLLVSIDFREEGRAKSLSKMSRVRRVLARHALLILFAVLFVWTVVGSLLALRAG